MKSKFKAGDLVVLSAAGRWLNQNEQCVGGFGFIETIMPDGDSDYPIKTKWWTQDLRVMNMNFKPYELKFYKNK